MKTTCIFVRSISRRPTRRGVGTPCNTSHIPVLRGTSLRADHPDAYQRAIATAPDPNGWFHARIVVAYPSIRVFVDDSTVPAMDLKQLSDRKSGWIGVWVGNNSRWTVRECDRHAGRALAGFHQTRTRSAGARYSFCPGFTSNAPYQGSRLRTVSARYSSSAWPSVSTCRRSTCSRSFERQLCANADEKRAIVVPA